MRDRIILLFFFSLVIVATYTGVWFYAAKQLEQRVEQFYYVEAPQFGVSFRSEGSRAGVVGYPLWPYAGYRGDISFPNGISVNSRDMLIKPALFDRNSIKIIFPNGVSLKGMSSNKFMSFEEVIFDLKLVGGLPAGLKKFYIQQWYDDGGVVDIKNLKIYKDSVERILFESSGKIKLSPDLQPFVEMNVAVYGRNALVNYVFQNGGIPNAVKKTAPAFKKLVKIDARTGEEYVETDISIKNKTLSVGPFSVMDMPKINWAE